MSSRFAIAVILTLLASSLALAGPPLLTDDPDTPGDKHWEINLAYTLDKRHFTSIQDAPDLDINYGVGDNVQLKYEVPWQVRHEAGAKSGVGNSTLGVKWRYLDEEKNGINMSTYPQFEFNSPTSSAARGGVDEGTNLLIPVELSKKFSQVTLNSEVGYTVGQYNADEWLYGLFAGFQIREGVTILSEIHGGSSTLFKSNEVVFNVGTQWDFTQGYALLASAGRSFRSALSDEPSLLLYLGVQMRL